MGLTPKQEAFCVAYVKSGNASEAYREAGYAPGSSEKTVNEQASRLLRNGKVTARLSELRQDAAQATRVTLESHLSDLLWLREMAAKSGKYAAAVQAEMARGKVVGLYIERLALSGGIEVTDKADLSTLSTDDLRAMHEMLARAGGASRSLQ
jgi:phage terminase small subunit